MATIPIYHATIVPPVTGAMSTEYFETFLNTTMNSTSGELITIMNHGKLVLSWREGIPVIPPAPEQDLLFTIDTSIDSSLSIKLDSSASYSGLIDWGDGSAEEVISGTGNTDISHTFLTTGLIQIRVSGSSVYKFSPYREPSVVSVENLGNVGLQDTSEMFDSCINLASVNIGDYVTSLGDFAFIECNNLTSITIGNSVTSIGDFVFYQCISLTSVIIPDSVTSLGVQAFYNCTLLESATLPDNVNFTIIKEGTFLLCTSLMNITIPDGVTNIGNYAFSNCTSLTSIIIPDSVISIGVVAFSRCTLLESLTLPDNVNFTSIEELTFQNCTSLTSINIPNSVTSIKNRAFALCSDLTIVTIGNSVSSIGPSTFQGCIGLTSITIPANVTSILYQTFRDCTLLETIDLSMPKSVIDAANEIFFNTASPLTLNVPTGTTGWVADTGLSIGGNTNVTVNLV